MQSFSTLTCRHRPIYIENSVFNANQRSNPFNISTYCKAFDQFKIHSLLSTIDIKNEYTLLALKL